MTETTQRTQTTGTPTLYHGTRAGFRGRGGLLMPRARHGGRATGAPVNSGREPLPDAEQCVYLTEHVELAWAYAWAAPGRGKPKVLVVRPLGPIEPDPEHSVEMAAWRCEAAIVEQVLTDPPFGEEEAKAGWATTSPASVRGGRR